MKLIFNRAYIYLFLSILFFYGCSSGKFLTSNDYKSSEQGFKLKSAQEAIENLPEGENGTFITTMEKTYLNLLLGNPDINDLEKYGDILDKRIRYKISKELKSFFYLKSPEGYYASEHELILLHMFLSWGYSLKGEYEKARVEARKSSHLLQAPWSEEGSFDDPMLRVFLGGLWALCESWEDARVDFRAASELNPSLQWAKELSLLTEMPKNFMIVLGGIGPYIYDIKNGEKNSTHSLRDVGFGFRGIKSQLEIRDNKNTIVQTHISPDSKNWYKRHVERDTAVHSFIEDTVYGRHVLATTSVEAVKVVATTAIALTLGIVSVAVGGYLIYEGARIGSELIVIGGSCIAGWGFEESVSMTSNSIDTGYKKIQKSLEYAKDYRFVRFLPEYIWAGWTDKEIEYPVKFYFNGKLNNDKLYQSSVISNSAGNVFIAHFPDTVTYR